MGSRHCACCIYWVSRPWERVIVKLNTHNTHKHNTHNRQHTHHINKGERKENRKGDGQKEKRGKGTGWGKKNYGVRMRGRTYISI